MAGFVHLSCHSVFSLLESCVPVSQLISAAKQHGMPAVALTDSNNLFGSIRFYREAKQAGIVPILGLSLDVFLSSQARPMIVLAMDNRGWENLKELSSAAFLLAKDHRPGVTQAKLFQHAESLILITGGLGSELHDLAASRQLTEATRLASELHHAFPGRFFIELTDHGIPSEQEARPVLIELARKLNIPLVATNQVFYLAPEHAEYHDTLLCIAQGKTKNDLERSRIGFGEFYFRSAEEMARLFADVPEAISNTVHIAERCRVEIPFPGPLLPDFQVPEDFDQTSRGVAREASKRLILVLDQLGDDYLARLARDASKKKTQEAAAQVRSRFLNRLSQPDAQYFVYLANEGLKRRYADIDPSLLQRLDYELTIIVLMDFVGYFLIVADFINWAKDRGIPVGPGRGSGAGSLVAYSLRITDIDPIRYGLLFERFLNPERISMPDFDVDFCYSRRQEVIDYVTRKYGTENVAQIITFGTLKPRAVVKDVGRVLGLSFSERNHLTKFIDDKKPDPDNPKKKLSLKKMVQIVPELKAYYDRGGIYKELFDTAAFLEGLPRHASTHAAGLVIGKTRLLDYCPLYKDPKTGVVVTQYTMEFLEDCGLVKMDFLGLKTLTLIQNTLDLLRDRGIHLTEDRIPMNDEKTFRLLCEGKSAMVFQFESKGMIRVLKKAKPRTIEELTALNALYRPGPMDNIPHFIARKFGQEPVTYPHPSLEPILKETYGILVYQEQVMQAAQILAGYTLGAADLLRRAMGKKNQEYMAKQRPIFTEGAQRLHGIPPEQANAIFDLLEKFADYGFNKSHAVAYSVLAYKTAYLKANYPAEFLAANLTNEIDKTETLARYLEEAREMGLEVIAPHVNVSEKYFAVRDGKITYGLLAIKNLGHGPVDEILRARKKGGPFQSLVDFLLRTDPRALGEKQVEVLIDCGALDGLGPNRATMKLLLPEVRRQVLKVLEERASGQNLLFGDPLEEIRFLPSTPVPEYDRDQKLEMEKKLLGFYFSGHPLDAFRDRWERYVNLDLRRVDRAQADQSYKILGRLSSVREFTTKKGETMAVGTLEDFNGRISLRVYPRVHERIRSSFQEGRVVGLSGKIERFEGEVYFIVEDLEAAEEVQETPLAVCIEIRAQPYRLSEISEIYDFLARFPGPSPLFLKVPNPDKNKKPFGIKTGLHVDASERTLETIRCQSWCERLWLTNPAFIKGVS